MQLGRGVIMPEEKIYIKNGSLIIEGLLCKTSGEKGVVICHPHPLMGGSMYNNVVETIQGAFAAVNYSTLRFNFRGAGKSTGVYDEGIGEKEDIIAAGEYLEKLGVKKLLLAGYSFGAWVGSKVLEERKNSFVAGIFVSPPINQFDFHWENLNNKINLFICGDCDRFCNIDNLIQKAQKINSLVEIISGADHFYLGKEKQLTLILRRHIIQ
jgi:alpha/beta superfamily hydrolase